jgi:hypothetical protein
MINKGRDFEAIIYLQPQKAQKSQKATNDSLLVFRLVLFVHFVPFVASVLRTNRGEVSQRSEARQEEVRTAAHRNKLW